MRCATWCAGLIGLALFLTVASGPAEAQATRTWVSGVGDDANPCSRTAPCKTFAGAISKTAAGGEISVLDPGGFGAVTITKSISIVNDYSGEAGILASATNGVTVNAAAADVVILRGLVIDGAPPGAPGLNGIRFLAGGSLHVEKCLIKNFTSSSSGNGNGILFAPTAASQLYVVDTNMDNNGSGTSGGAITIRPTGSGSARVMINNVNADHNANGFLGDGASTSAGTAVVMIVRDSVASGSPGAGVAATTPAAGGGAVGVVVDRTTSYNNATGVSSTVAQSFVTLTVATVTANTTGALPASSGQILTFQNNFFVGNSSDGATTGTVTLK
jgi:hypothetical protein